MPAEATRRLLTFEDAARLDPDREGGEVVRGEWVPVTRNTWKHGEVVVNIAVLLKLWARSHPGWSIAAADPGTKLSRSPATLRGPDVAMVRADRVPEGRGADGWLEGAPELAVEVLGDTQSVAQAMQKALEYLEAGAKLVWLIDRESARVVVLTPPDHVRTVPETGELDGGDVLPDFRCKVEELFAR